MLYGICETLNGNWSQLDMTTEVGASTTVAAIALTTFWGMVTVGRVLFAAIQRRFPSHRAYRLLPFVLVAAFVAIAALPDGGAVAGVLAFGLAGLGCSALLPLTISFAQEDLVAISAATAGLVIAAYQLGYGIAAFGAGPLQDAGVSLPAIFAIGAVAAAVMAGLSFVIARPQPPAHRACTPDRPETPLQSTARQGATPMNLKDKVAIVTGGNSGIGMGIVLALAEEGANIVIDYVAHPEATEELEQRVHALGDQAIGVEADVSKVADLQRLVDSAVKAFGRVDVMVNNAGIETRTSVLDTTEEQYERVLDINLKSAFFGTQIAAKQMIAQGGGRPDHQHLLGPRGLADAGQHRRTACPRAACACSPAPPASSSPPTACSSSVSAPAPSTRRSTPRPRPTRRR